MSNSEIFLNIEDMVCKLYKILSEISLDFQPLKGNAARFFFFKVDAMRIWRKSEKVLFLCLLKIYSQEIFTHNLCAEDLPKINQIDHEVSLNGFTACYYAT